tara:strand:+ start:440 stop:841 length:402 start_codon:yes stop_codon:yes gene_type:complete
MSDNLVLFIDNIGRTVIGAEEPKSSTKTSLAVKNPAIVNVQVQEDGQISVQLFPFMFREFLTGASRDDGVVWRFNTNNITQNRGIELDERLTTQYVNLFLDPAPVAPTAPASDPQVVELFDDEPEEVAAEVVT